MISDTLSKTLRNAAPYQLWKRTVEYEGQVTRTNHASMQTVSAVQLYLGKVPSVSTNHYSLSSARVIKYSMHRLLNPLLTSDLVTKALRLDNGDIIDDTLVEVEVLGKPTKKENSVSVRQLNELGLSGRCFVVYLLAVILLDDSSGGSLDGLGSNSTHFEMCVCVLV